MRAREFAVAGALIGMVGAGPALAECTDAGVPGVDWRLCFFDRQDLREVDLTDDARLAEADLTKADLTGASFRNSDLRRARLFRAILRGADMTGARMRGADILKADFTGATWIDGKRICAAGSIGKCR